jgi:hypothetical protein
MALFLYIRKAQIEFIFLAKTVVLNINVAYLLKARTVEPEKQPLPGNARMQQ